jgi:hypothetical protein
MTTKARNWLGVFLILAFPFVLFFGFLITELNKPLLPTPSLPKQNGYDDFVNAGKMLASNTSDFYKMNEQELQTLVDGNSNALQLARSGLQKQSVVRLKYSAASPANFEELSDLKQLAQAFAAEGRLAEMDNRPNDAAKSYSDTINLGIECCHGGIVIDELVGIAIEAIGTSYLQKIADNLDAATCRKSAIQLQTFDSQRQTWDEIVQQEHDWSRRTFPGIGNELTRIMAKKSLEKTLRITELKLKTQEQKTRQLEIDLVTRAYKLDKGHQLESVSDLVPDYLKTIPQDPFTGTNMVYSPR